MFRKMMTKKLTEAAESVVEPAKKTVQDRVDAAKKVVGDRSDWAANVLKMLIAGALMIFTFREENQKNLVNSVQRSNTSVPNIIINNIFKEDPHDHKYQRNVKR